MRNILNFINKYPKKRVIAVCVSAVMILLLAVMPLAASKKSGTDSFKASVLSATVQKGDVNSVLIGAGTLSDQSGEKINIPTNVKIKSFLVSNGDTVKKGDDLAKIDKVTLMQSINEVQETMTYLKQKMEETENESSTDKVMAQKSGTVKAVYAKKGDDVQNVMLKKGALAVLSLDNLMCVEIKTDKIFSAGDSVKITFGDKTQVSGQVKTCLDGVVSVTFEDNDYTEGTKVTVTAKDGKKIGSGKIQINNRWTATAYSGTVSDVKVSQKEKVSSGEALFSLENVSGSATYDNLASQHRKYEELMLSLFKMYQSSTIKAPIDGTVSGIDKESTMLLSATDDENIELLANAPGSDSEASYNNYIGKIVSVNGGAWNVKLNPSNQSVSDYKNLSGVNFSEGSMTKNTNFSASIPVYTLSSGNWVQIGKSAVGAGDVLLFAGNGTSSIVWAVRVIKGNHVQPTTEATTTTRPTTTQPSAPATTQQTTTKAELPDTTNPATDVTKPTGEVDITKPDGDVTKPTGEADMTKPDTDTTKPTGEADMPKPDSDTTKPTGEADMTKPDGDATKPTGEADMTKPDTDTTKPTGDIDMTKPNGDVSTPAGQPDMTKPNGDISVPATSQSDTAKPDSSMTAPSNQQSAQMPGGSFSSGFVNNGSFSQSPSDSQSSTQGQIQSGAIQSENETELFDLEGTTVLSVTAQDTMTVSVTVDELDLSKISTGMKAEITLDAFMGEAFEGTVSNIGTSGENSGGNSKFSVEITMDRSENMLSGMNATAKIVLSSEKDVLTVPVEALCDLGNETVIYTKYNKSDDILEKPVTVTVGASDGEVAQIISGLDEGQKYYYSYYDEYQSSENSAGFSFGGFGMGGFGGPGGGNRRPGR